jgi:integrase
MALRFDKLSRPAIRALSAGEKITEHCITAERMTNGDAVYSINLMVDGKRIHRVVGRESDKVNREQAEQLIQQLRTEAREGRLNLPKGRKLHRTFSEAAEKYIERMEASGGKDLVNKTRHLRSYLMPHFGKDRLDKLSTYELQLYRKARRDAGAKDATINRELSTLQHLLNRAASKAWGWVRKEDLPEIPKVREERKKIRILSQEQREALLRGAAVDHDERAWLFVMFGLNASMRHSEIVQRRYDEIDFDQCRIWINRAKAGEREQPITAALRDALASQRKKEVDAGGWIFPAIRKNTKNPHREDMRAAFARSASRAGLDTKVCTPHVMRHTAITALVKQKVDVPTIQKISGHKTASMVMHYVHVFGQHIDDAINGLKIGGVCSVTPKLHTAPNPEPSGGANDLSVFPDKSTA